MNYSDVNGLHICKQRWEQLYRDPGYGLVDITRIGFATVKTSWVGCYSSMEQRPGLFITQIIMDDLAKDKKNEEPIWSSDKKTAREAHDEVCRSLDNNGRN